jgi:hypothetical protein
MAQLEETILNDQKTNIESCVRAGNFALLAEILPSIGPEQNGKISILVKGDVNPKTGSVQNIRLGQANSNNILKINGWTPTFEPIYYVKYLDKKTDDIIEKTITNTQEVVKFLWNHAYGSTKSPPKTSTHHFYDYIKLVFGPQDKPNTKFLHEILTTQFIVWAQTKDCYPVSDQEAFNESQFEFHPPKKAENADSVEFLEDEDEQALTKKSKRASPNQESPALKRQKQVETSVLKPSQTENNNNWKQQQTSNNPQNQKPNASLDSAFSNSSLKPIEASKNGQPQNPQFKFRQSPNQVQSAPLHAQAPNQVQNTPPVQNVPPSVVNTPTIPSVSNLPLQKPTTIPNRKVQQTSSELKSESPFGIAFSMGVCQYFEIDMKYCKDVENAITVAIMQFQRTHQ